MDEPYHDDEYGDDTDIDFMTQNKLRADLAAARAEIEELKRGKLCDGCESFDPLGGYTDGADSHCIGCSRFEPRDNFKPRDPSAEKGVKQ